MAAHNELGKKGEQLAADDLRKKGYRIIELNWTLGHQEIDIIAQDKDILVFVEVKTRATSYFETAEGTITKAKQRLLIQAADSYVRRNNITMEGRFDVVFIIKNKQQQTIEHIVDAFSARTYL